MTAGIAFFDDYPGPVLGHHPDLLLGLAQAATHSAQVRVYCPPSYLAGAAPAPEIQHRPAIGRRLIDTRITRRNFAQACDDAVRAGVSVFINLFLDESYVGLGATRPGMRIVHVVHRPGELTRSRTARAALRETRDILVVHTERGFHQLRRLAPLATVTRLAWPAAAVPDIKRRFGEPAPRPPKHNVLMLGGARRDKGIAPLLEAVRDGPPLLIAGELAPEDEQFLLQSGMAHAVSWERQWVPRSVLEESLTEAAAVVFPYLPEFSQHGGASGALALATTYAKPLVVSDVLSADLDGYTARMVVPAHDVAALRSAIRRATAETAELHRAARGSIDMVLRAHSYESHLAQLLATAEG